LSFAEVFSILLFAKRIRGNEEDCCGVLDYYEDVSVDRIAATMLKLEHKTVIVAFRSY